jgi:hypothetical protein
MHVTANEHVISDYENEIVDVHFIDNGALFEANVTSTDPEADIAVLEITLDSNQTTSSPIEPLILANSSEIRQGQQVLAISPVIASSSVSIYPPDSKPYGLTYADHAVNFWKWLLPMPANNSPMEDPTGAKCTNGQ